MGHTCLTPLLISNQFDRVPSTRAQLTVPVYRTCINITIFSGRPKLRSSNQSAVRSTVKSRWGRQKSRFSTNIWLSDRWLLQCEQQLRRSIVQFTAQTARNQWILFITTSMDDHDEEKRTDRKLIRSGKPEAELAMRSTYCTTPCSKKASPLMFDNNFGKCGPIFKILSSGDS